MIVESSIYPLIKDLTITDLSGPIRESISNALAIRGVKHEVSAEMILDMRDVIVNDLKTHFRTLRLNEVCLAIDMGAKGMLKHKDDLNGVSVELIENWIRRFKDIRSEAFAKQRKHELEILEGDKQKIKQEGDAVLKLAILKCYEDFCSGISIKESLSYSPDPVHLASIHYRYLGRRKFITISDEDSEMMHEIAKGIILGKEPKKSDDQKAWSLFHQTRESQALSLARYMALEQQFELWKKQSYTLKFD